LLDPWKTASKLHKGLEVTVMQTAERGLDRKKTNKQTTRKQMHTRKAGETKSLNEQ
jgi:hypothetical protein